MIFAATALLCILLLFYSVFVSAGKAPEWSSCSTDNNHIDPYSHKYLDDCDDKTFCSGPINGTCILKKCRSDEFPFGFREGDYLPPLCPEGTFCPDEGSGCQPLSLVGASCQLNKDDQCAPPPDWRNLASNQNANGSLCFGSVCIFANTTISQLCLTDSTTYVSLGPSDQEFTTIVIRHNCRTPQLYCDLYTHVCEPTKPLGFPCSYDQECQSYNCDSSNTCSESPDTESQVPVWQYGLVIATILFAMITVLTSLVFVHKRQRLRRYQALRDYYYEQMDFRRSIAALHSAAANKYRRDKSV